MFVVDQKIIEEIVDVFLKYFINRIPLLEKL